MRPAQALLLLIWTFLPSGCHERPRAPVLRDDPVYQNDREGIRFLAPDGWGQTLRGEVPRGKVEKERTLVDYRRPIEGPTPERPASLRVSLVDLPPSTDLAAFLAKRAYSIARWRLAGPVEEATVGTLSGQRYYFLGQSDRGELAREVVAVRRGERVYFFTAVFEPKDTEVRDQLRRVVASVIWKK